MRTLKLLTIVAEAVLESEILSRVRELGARGYTLTEARGEGTRGTHAVDWEGQNLKVEMVVSPEVAERILEYVQDEYFTHYSVIAYVHDVEVVRGEKYV